MLVPSETTSSSSSSSSFPSSSSSSSCVVMLLPEKHPLQSVESNATRIWLVLSFFIGFLMGYISFIVGSIFAVLGIRSLINLLRYQQTWIYILGQSWEDMETIQGNVIEKRKVVDSITSDIAMFLVIEYNLPSSSSATTTTIRKELKGPPVRLIYNHMKEGDIIRLKIYPNLPQSAIPCDLLYHKLKDCAFWTRYGTVAMSFIGFQLYLFGAITYAWITSRGSDLTFWMLIFATFLALALMTPYLIVEQSYNHQQRVKILHSDPVQLTSEFDMLRKAWHDLGPSLVRKSYVLLLAIGVFQMVMVSGWGFLPGCIAVWTFAQLTSATLIRREYLESYVKPTGESIQGHVIDHRRIVEDKKLRHWVKVRYIAPKGQLVEKEIDDKGLYQQYEEQTEKMAADLEEDGDGMDMKPSSTTKQIPIDLLVMPKFPLSGYPINKLNKDISESISLSIYQIIFILSLFGYGIGIWNNLYMDLGLLLDYPLNEGIPFLWRFSLGPILMFPQVYILHRLQYKQLVKATLFTGSVITSNEKREKQTTTATS